jgi:hypothetical protein
MEDRMDDSLDIGMLLADPVAASRAFARWSGRLAAYVQQQGSLDALRLRPISEPPWPTDDNPMLSYLVERTAEIAEDEDAGVAAAWLARQAWLEATIAERSRVARLLCDEPS